MSTIPQKTKHPLYVTWQKMKDRCYNPNSHAYSKYGGRGIKVCERWHDFNNFVYDMGEKPTKQHTLDRIDNDGDYCPENCRWATQLEQQNNTSYNRNITIDGKTMSTSAWCRHYGIKLTTYYQRLKLGWDYYTALVEPVKQNNPK